MYLKSIHIMQKIRISLHPKIMDEAGEQITWSELTTETAWPYLGTFMWATVVHPSSSYSWMASSSLYVPPCKYKQLTRLPASRSSSVGPPWLRVKNLVVFKVYCNTFVVTFQCSEKSLTSSESKQDETKLDKANIQCR